jgi:glucan endo-1,3-beta-D-glucosidase
MKFLFFFTFALLSPALSQKIYQGFNTGAFSGTDTPKTQSDFEKEFLSAQSLYYSPGIFSSARLYTCVQHKTTNTPIAAFQAAINTNTSLLLGIWCSGTTSIDNELTALKSAISQYGDKFTSLVVGVSVDSEDLYRGSEVGQAKNAGVGAGPDAIVGFVRDVKSALAGTALKGTPVGHVDSWVAWTNGSNGGVVDEVDFLGVDAYPYYEDKIGNAIENATNVFEDLYNRTLGVAGGKPVWITETGWPTR